MSLKQKVLDVLSARGIARLDWSFEVVMQDDSDSKGPFLAKWDEQVAGPMPTGDDGFSDWELHALKVENGKG